MTNADLMEILTVADTIENNGGWHIAAVKLRAFVGEYKRQTEELKECRKVRDEWCAEYTIIRDSHNAFLERLASTSSGADHG